MKKKVEEDQFLISPLTGEKISADKAAEHMKVKCCCIVEYGFLISFYRNLAAGEKYNKKWRFMGGGNKKLRKITTKNWEKGLKMHLFGL